MIRVLYKQKPITVFLSFLAVDPQYWDSKKERCKLSGAYPQAREINLMISQINDMVEAECIQALRSCWTDSRLKQAIQDGIDAMLGLNSSPEKTLLQALDEYFQQNPRGLKKSSLMKFNALKEKLLLYSKSQSWTCSYDSVDARFGESFSRWMEGKGYLNDTIAKAIDNLKTFMRWAMESGYHNATAFQKIKKSAPESNDPVYLYEEELNAFLNYDFDGLPPVGKHWGWHIATLKNARDMFCFACYTGQRYSDIKNLKWTDIVLNALGQPEWHLYQIKGNKRLKVIVPIAQQAIQITERQDNTQLYVFHAPSGQKYNDSLKEAAKLAALNRNISKVRYSGKKRIESLAPLHDLMSSHKARSTFVTLLKSKKISDKVIMSMTGHTDVRTMMRYEGVGDQAKNDAIKEAFGVI